MAVTASAQWTVITDVLSVFYDQGPTIAMVSQGHIWVADGKKLQRIGPVGEPRWSSQVPLQISTAVAVDARNIAFVTGSTETGSALVRLDASGAVESTTSLTGQPQGMAIDAAGALYIAGSAGQD